MPLSTRCCMGSFSSFLGCLPTSAAAAWEGGGAASKHTLSECKHTEGTAETRANAGPHLLLLLLRAEAAASVQA